MVIEGNQCSLEDNNKPTAMQMEEGDGNIGEQKNVIENTNGPSSSPNHNPQREGRDQSTPASSTNVPDGTVKRYSLRSQSRVLYARMQ